MKALEIIKCIKEIQDDQAVKLLEDIFMFGYIKGVNQGYSNAIKLYQDKPTFPDKEEGRVVFVTRYL